MRLHTPQFWTKRNWRAYALLPISCLYRAIYTLIRWKKITPYRSQISVICIGNAVIGGSGKTPTAIMLAALLMQQGKRVGFISRGYGGSIAKNQATQVDPTKHAAGEVGDEPLLLAKHAPCFVAANRVDAVKLAEKHGRIDILIMDDGLQNETIHKTISLLVMHGAYGVGNGFQFPAGPLREPLTQIIQKVDGLLVNGILSDDKLSHITASLPQFGMKLTPSDNDLHADKNYIAFAGIAHPERFFDTLRELGITLADTASFADHQPYQESELEELDAAAKKQQATLITTEKDWVRLPSKWQSRIAQLPVEHQALEADKLMAWLNNALNSKS